MYTNLDEIRKLEKFSYNCYYCGKLVVIDDVSKFVDYLLQISNYDRDVVLDAFNNPMYNLCKECAEEQ